MKNIYLLPTENSSTLSIDNGVLTLHRPQWRKGTQYMYITSDEEIMEGDYWYDYLLETVNKGNLVGIQRSKKIILTTDRELNKAGVWGIADDILEWYVKNPTCEYVELIGYAVVLPGESCDCNNKCDACKEEEPKQERMYSDEDLKEIIYLTWLKCLDANGGDFIDNRNEILKQFKKK